MDTKMLAFISWVLVIFGGISWLLVGLFKHGIVDMIFGDSMIAHLIYIIIGLAACYLIYLKIQNKPEAGG